MRVADLNLVVVMDGAHRRLGRVVRVRRQMRGTYDLLLPLAHNVVRGRSKSDINIGVYWHARFGLGRGANSGEGNGVASYRGGTLDVDSLKRREAERTKDGAPTMNCLVKKLVVYRGIRTYTTAVHSCRLCCRV